MKVTFIYPDLIGSANYGGVFYPGIGSLSGVLKEAGHQTSMIHITQPITREDFLRSVEKEDAVLYVFSCTTMMSGFVKELSGWIKSKDKTKLIIVGGVHAFLAPEELISIDSVDFVCVGEGEYALRDLCSALLEGRDVSSIPNLWSKHNGRIFRNAPRPLISDLDSLPFPDRTIFNYKKLMEGREEMFFFMASRGCPYGCPYCCNHALRDIYNDPDSWVRIRSVENVIREIKLVLENYPSTKYVAFFDDILALRKDWFRKFTEHYKDQIGLPFRCNMRANYLADEETVKMLSEAGCGRVIIGLESGNEYVRNKIIGRNMPESILIEAGKLCKKYRIELATYNMLGVPQESFSAMLDTVKLNAKIKADFTYVSIYYPFPKTALYELCKKKNLLTDRIVTDYVEGSVLNFDRFTHIRILFIRDYFRPLMSVYRLIYSIPAGLSSYFERIFDSILSSKILAVTIFSFADWFFKAVRENRILASCINRIKRMAKMPR